MSLLNVPFLRKIRDRLGNSFFKDLVNGRTRRIISIIPSLQNQLVVKQPMEYSTPTPDHFLWWLSIADSVQTIRGVLS